MEVDSIATQYGLSKEKRSLILETIRCETMGTFDPSLQSTHRYKRDNAKWGVKAGEQERSFGLAQIHLPSWPDITIDQAKDTRFAL
jgi:hypothetical protein